jgi:hypothetical protein
MLMTQKDSRSLVKKEADSKKDQMEPAQIIKDPYVLEFLNLKSNTSFFENELGKGFLLIDLKTGELTHQDIGQMDFYVRYFEDRVRLDSDNPTIGLILCAESNRTIVKYSLLKDSQQIFASKYKLYLPTENELKRELSRERKMIDQEKKLKQE